MPETAVRYIGDHAAPTTIPAILRERAELTPYDRCLTFDKTVRTFAEMLVAAERAAAALASLGVRKGSKVAALLPNSTEILDIWLGASLLGAVFVPINRGLKGEGLRHIVEHSGAEFIGVDAPLLDTLEKSVPLGRGPRHRYVRGSAELPPGYDSLSALFDGGHAAAPTIGIDPGDLASILYTSGTTGLPKGVMNCHNAFAMAANEFTRRYVRVRQDDVFYTTLPLFHANAQTLTIIGGLVAGRPVVVAPRFSASGFFGDLRAHGATVFNSIGAMLTMLYKQPERREDADSRVRLAISAAAPAQLWQLFEKRFGLKILEIYGLTETATFCLGNPPDDIRVGTIGKPVSWSKVRIEDADGRELPDGQPGEIAIKSEIPHTMFLGYYKNEDATQAATAGGWFHSGDRGCRDADGYFVFLDRLKDCIRRRGENIASYEIERIVNTHPLVAESAAVGVPSDLGEEEVMVVLVLVPSQTEFDCADLVRYCEERMADFMLPRYIRLADHLPKTPTQRVEKYKLRALGIQDAWDRSAADVASTQSWRRV